MAKRTVGVGNRVRKVSAGRGGSTYYDPLGLSWERTTFQETFNLNFHGRLVFSSTAAMTPTKVWMHGDSLGDAARQDERTTWLWRVTANS